MLTTTGLNLALKGHPVLLRNGSQAYIIADLRTLPEPREVLVVFLPTDKETYLVELSGRCKPDEACRYDVVSLAPAKRFHWGDIDPKWQAIAADADGKVYLYTTTDLFQHEDGRHDFDSDSHPEEIHYKDMTGILTLEYHTWKTSQQNRPS